jgi:hypothetical protein
MIAPMAAVPPQPNPELYSQVKVVISIIVGLCITILLKGFAQFVQHPRRNKVSILHLGWAASLLLGMIHFWWWEFRLTMVQQWTFAIYFVILYAILFFLSTLLFPSDLADYTGYEDYFLSRRRWFFGFLAATFLADIIDTSLKGAAYLHSFCLEYPIRIAAYLVVCIIAMITKNRRTQLMLLTLSGLYQISYIVRLYATE